MQSLLVAGVEIKVGSTIRPTYEKVPGETKTYDAIVEELKPSKTGLDTIILIKLIEGGYRSLLASKVAKIEFHNSYELLQLVENFKEIGAKRIKQEPIVPEDIRKWFQDGWYGW